MFNFARMKDIIIYKLSDPFTGKTRYIGKTKEDLGIRLYGHIYAAKTEDNEKAKWINGLIKEGVNPIIEVIEIVKESEWEEKEVFYIKKYREKEKDLLNIANGGKCNYETSGDFRRKSKKQQLKYRKPYPLPKIAIILKQQGRSKKWLQEQLGMTRTTFYYFLRGERQNKIDKIKEVAELLEVKVDDVI